MSFAGMSRHASRVQSDVGLPGEEYLKGARDPAPVPGETVEGRQHATGPALRCGSA